MLVASAEAILKKGTNLSNKSTSKKSHVFITGLARSGSTAILNQFYVKSTQNSKH